MIESINYCAVSLESEKSNKMKKLNMSCKVTAVPENRQDECLDISIIDLS